MSFFTYLLNLNDDGLDIEWFDNWSQKMAKFSLDFQVFIDEIFFTSHDESPKQND